jgi:hypothetical protein
MTDQLARDRARISDLGDDYADGNIDRAEYLRLSSRLRSRIESAERKMSRLHVVEGSGLDIRGQGEVLRSAWDRMTLDERRAVIAAVADHFVIGPGVQPMRVFRPERIKPVWRFSDEVAAAS